MSVVPPPLVVLAQPPQPPQPVFHQPLEQRLVAASIGRLPRDDVPLGDDEIFSQESLKSGFETPEDVASPRPLIVHPCPMPLPPSLSSIPREDRRPP